MATSLYFVKDPTEDEKSSLEARLNKVRGYFSDNKEIDWDRLTTDMTYDDHLWYEVGSLFGHRGTEIVNDVLKLPIKKVF